MIKKTEALVNAILDLMHKPPYLVASATVAYWVGDADYHLTEAEKYCNEVEKSIADFRAALAEARNASAQMEAAE